MKTLQERFDEKYMPVPESGCWVWIGAAHPRGYGHIWKDGGAQWAHRVSWELHNGEVPPEMHVLHKCDITSCVNPNHLFLGDHKANMIDMALKGRAAKILTPEQVKDIRGDSRVQTEIAAEYGICQQMVSSIKNRERWQHL